MDSIKIIHIVDFENKNIWFEEYLTILSQYEIDQEVVAIKKNPYLRFFCLQNQIPFGGGTQYFFYSLLKIPKGKKADFLLSHGYKPSIFAQLLNRITSIRFMIIHHHQPNFFNLLRSRKYFKAAIHLRIAGLCYQSSFAIQSFSSEVRNTLLEFGVSKTKIFFNPIGINLKSMQNQALSSQQEYSSQNLEKKIISVCRLSWEKNLSLAIEAVVRANQIGGGIQYDIYGDGPEKESLIKLIKDRKAEAYIHLKGFDVNILSKIQAADLLLHTSLTESYGQVIFEAFFLNTPILSSRVGVSIDIANIDPSKIQLISDNSPKGLANQIITFLNRDYLKQPMSEVEVTFIQEHSMSESVSNLVTFLNDSLGPMSKHSR